MTKQEFLNALGTKLQEGMSSSRILSQVRYYEGYIDGEIAKGKTEEEAVADLGDPILIARNILESPREDDSSIFVSSEEDQEDAYEEGSYQGENQHSEEEVRQAVREDVPLGETTAGKTSEDVGNKAHKEQQKRERQTADHTRETHRQEEFRKSEEKTDDPYNGSIPIQGEDDESEERERFENFRSHTEQKTRSEKRDEAQEDDVKTGSGLFHDEHGHFRWDLFGVILAFAVGLTAVIWLVTKIVTAMSPVAIIIILVIIVIFLVIHFRS